ncbi:hypothetical protein IMSHALPRED_010017 [Imshaugia aleurites]|uniref:Amidohydrolase-related domain-containing protein n=1 Tax=Imshaugia aleurites TaxID=172621 RepID=A0A8H3IF46_9LECA|nr:hypothetical protein IMSHALPRED_010017 [Imshaugia aleurites]
MATFNFMPEMAKILIANVKYFDGNEMIYTPHNIYVADGLIVKLELYDPEASLETGWFPVHGDGAFLIPGLIDSHIHLLGVEELQQLCAYGITSAMDMATFPLALLQALRKIAGQNGLPDIRFGGIGASTRTSNWAIGGLVQNPKDAANFIQTQVSQGADHCKVVMDDDHPAGMVPFDMETLHALIHSAHEHGKKMIAHACTIQPYRDAITAGLDIITHTPMDEALDPTTASKMVGKVISVPTLCMQHNIIQRNPQMAQGANFDFCHPTNSLKAMYDSGVDILVGTDSNAAEVSPGHPMHGVSIHHEMELLVSAGMKPVDVLKAATSKPARVFGLDDRGVIKEGKRADLVLLANDPTANIQATRMIKQVWAKGVPYLPLRPLAIVPSVPWGYFMQINDVTSESTTATTGKTVKGPSCCS